MNSKEFFNEIYKGCDEGYITLTLLPQRKTLWFKVKELGKLCEAARKYGANTNTFFGVGLRKKILPHNLRGRDSDISCVAALYSDIDVKSDAHAEMELPTSVSEAVEFLRTLPLKPSIIVNSGNGLHAY